MVFFFACLKLLGLCSWVVTQCCKLNEAASQQTHHQNDLATHHTRPHRYTSRTVILNFCDNRHHHPQTNLLTQLKSQLNERVTTVTVRTLSRCFVQAFILMRVQADNPIPRSKRPSLVPPPVCDCEVVLSCRACYCTDSIFISS